MQNFKLSCTKNWTTLNNHEGTTVHNHQVCTCITTISGRTHHAHSAIFQTKILQLFLIVALYLLVAMFPG